MMSRCKKNRQARVARERRDHMRRSATKCAPSIRIAAPGPNGASACSASATSSRKPRLGAGGAEHIDHRRLAGLRHPCRSVCRPARYRLRHRADRRRSGRPGRRPSRSARAPCAAAASPIRACRRPGRRSATARRSSSPARCARLPRQAAAARLPAKRPSAARSSIWPPTMPPSPEARASALTSSMRTAGSGWVCVRDRMSKAKVKQAVAGEDRGRLVECLVRGRLAAPQVVIVHGRQVVVHQRVAMHAFERRAGHQRLRPRNFEQGRAIPPPGMAGTACRRRGSNSAWLRSGGPAGQFAGRRRRSSKADRAGRRYPLPSLRGGSRKGLILPFITFLPSSDCHATRRPDVSIWLYNR